MHSVNLTWWGYGDTTTMIELVQPALKTAALWELYISPKTPHSNRNCITRHTLSKPFHSLGKTSLSQEIHFGPPPFPYTCTQYWLRTILPLG